MTVDRRLEAYATNILPKNSNNALLHYFFIYIAMTIGAFCTFIAVTAMRRGETHNVGKFGWLLMILLSPPIGLVLFLWLGGKKISAEHDKRDIVDLPSCDRETATDDSLAEIGVTRGLQPPCGRNRMSLLDSPEAIYEHLFEIVDSAEHRLFIHTFILSDDDLGKKLISKLCEKANSGIDVRLMIDGFGSFVYPNEQLQRLDEAGGKSTWFKPMGNLSRFAYLNFRNHRKVVVADGRRAMLGGANLVGYEVTQSPDDETWIDLSLRIDGCVARQIEAVFASDWEFATDETIDLNPKGDLDSDWPESEQANLQTIPIGPDSPSEIIDDLWLTAISRAKESVWIVTPYFVPPPLAMRSLVMAIRRGVDVRIIVPDRSDMRPADYARIDYFRDLDELGAKIYRHPDRVVHSKAVIIDQRVAYVGSANFDMRSFFLNYELIVGIFNESKVSEVRRWYENLTEQCELGIEEDSYKRRFLGTLARMVAEEL